MGKRMRNLGAVVLAAAALGMGGAATASAQPVSTASVSTDSVQAAFITPYFGMNCWTWVSGTFGNYYGNATCSGTGQWFLRVDCTAGFTYDSPKALQIDATEISTRRAGSCYWGVNSMKIIEVPF